MHRRYACLLLLLCIALAPALYAAEAESRKITLDAWLTAGPLDLQAPATIGEASGFGTKEWLQETVVPVADLRPAPGRALTGTALTWRAAGGGDGKVELERSADAPRMFWAATWIETGSFLPAELAIESEQPVKVFVDGAEVATVSEVPKEGPAVAKAHLDLFTGKHLVLVQALGQSGDGPWTLSGSLAVGEKLEAPSVGTSPSREVQLGDLLDVARYTSLALSPDGRYLLISGSRPAVPSEHQERWSDVVDAADGKIVRTLRAGESSVRWTHREDAPELVFAVPSPDDKDASHVYRSVVTGGEWVPVAESLKHLQDLRVLPDGSGLVVEQSVPQEADERGVKRYRDLPDRWTGRRDPSHWSTIDWNGNQRRITVGSPSTRLLDVRGDGGALLLGHTRYDAEERPFSTNELVQVELKTLETRSLLTLKWFDDALYSPDGKTLLVTGSPALFDGAGARAGEQPIPNDYDTQAYLVPVDDPGAVRPITADYDPSILSAYWPAEDGQVYFRVQDRSWSRLVRFDPVAGTFEDLPAATDTLADADVRGGSLAYVGSSPNRAHAVFAQSVAVDAEPRLLLDPSAKTLQDVTFGKVEPWTFTSTAGDEILGRIYYPPGFDASKTYPLLVYYYGGTVPVDRSFGGRYPKELWAAEGYVVYVPQPSGATGFGQEFSARHVNAWGRRTADEIIEGTRKLLDEHAFLDASRVGCLGASYGGFMTMYLQTRTDLFAAAVSHAGISNLASYWGKGWWGYLYSAAASAESYPWNNPELYVGQSPLYAADKIETPLLLLHGDADTNVPPVESHQMYTALKLLGKEVELIEIGGENHTILTYPKRQLWARTILAWFDHHLKDEPQAWTHLWGEADKPKG